jgi:cation diffusion facilitator family transporter
MSGGVRGGIVTAAVEPQSLSRFAWLSIAAAVVTIALKTIAWHITGSVGLLSDALESIVNLVAAIVALLALRVAESPADEEHAHGHEKVEYFSSGLEGALILAAAAAIAFAAMQRLLHPAPIEALGFGLAVNVAASAVNLVVARVLLGAAKRYRSIVLEADGHHLMTDVWTSAGVVAGLGLVHVTGLSWLDPVVAIGVACNIVITGIRLLRRSGRGLLDASLPAESVGEIERTLAGFRPDGVAFHALKTRQAGTRTFVSVHLLVPGSWSVKRGHDMAERVEAAIRELAPKTTVLTHLEPIEDPASYEDQGLDRG